MRRAPCLAVVVASLTTVTALWIGARPQAQAQAQTQPRTHTQTPAVTPVAPPVTPPAQVARRPGATPRNIVFILADDHRYDAMGFLGHPFVQTPHMDRMAKGGAHVRNAFVTTALCSPSRASILTGTYAHRHGVVDNFTSIPPGLPNVGEYLQQATYQTG